MSLGRNANILIYRLISIEGSTLYIKSQIEMCVIFKQ